MPLWGSVGGSGFGFWLATYVYLRVPTEDAQYRPVCFWSLCAKSLRLIKDSEEWVVKQSTLFDKPLTVGSRPLEANSILPTANGVARFVVEGAQLIPLDNCICFPRVTVCFTREAVKVLRITTTPGIRAWCSPSVDAYPVVIWLIAGRAVGSALIPNSIFLISVFFYFWTRPQRQSFIYCAAFTAPYPCLHLATCIHVFPTFHWGWVGSV
jgi:hypothetical protein